MNVLSEKCPECGADVNQPCHYTSPPYEVAPNAHSSRYTVARLTSELKADAALRIKRAEKGGKP